MGRISFTLDMWSDANQTPYMAVTAHWIEGVTENTAHGPKLVLKLQSDLVGFEHIPGHHDGAHLGYTFLHVIDHLEVAEKVQTFFSLAMILMDDIQPDWMDNYGQGFK